MEYQHLLGRPFSLGGYDCFALLRDFYWDNFQIRLRNYARPNDWKAKNLDIIGMSYEQEGFEKVQEWTLKTLNPGDVLCMAINSPVPNHNAVYVGENKIVHHLAGSLSRDETLRDFWRKSICYVLRHPDVPIVKEEKPSISLVEILRAKNRNIPEEVL